MLSYHSLDKHINVERFLNLEDEFYFLYAKNKDKVKSVWNAGGFPTDCKWEYLTNNPLLYYTYHKHHNDPKVKDLNKEELATYLQLKYGSFNPYRILHLLDYSPDHNFEPWVTDSIKNWVESLPFERFDSVSLFYNDHYCPLKYHRDFNFFPFEDGDAPNEPDTVQDLIWFRFDLDRGFNLYDISEDGTILETLPIEGYSATFNHYNWHGNTDAYDKASLTVKVEGKFRSDFKYV